jgi:hypothetical protein
MFEGPEFDFLEDRYIISFSNAAKPTLEFTKPPVPDKSGRAVNLIAHVHLLLRVKMRGATRPIPYMSFRRDA